jgi:hypothetical protein
MSSASLSSAPAVSTRRAAVGSQIANVSHWIGSQCPYGAISEEMESRQPVRIARYSAASEAPAEEVISMVGKLHLHEGGE